MHDTAPLLITPRQAAAMLAISERTLWQLTHDGKLPFLRLGRLVRYPLVQLNEWIEQQQYPRKGA